MLINMKTANALSLSIPQSVMLRADRVIAGLDHLQGSAVDDHRLFTSGRLPAGWQLLLRLILGLSVGLGLLMVAVLIGILVLLARPGEGGR